jgi:uncharacterized membrane protein required for colicin V production
MNIILDFIILGIIILCVYRGYRNGLIKTVTGLLSFAAAYIMARIFSPPLSGFIYENWIKPNFVSGVAARLEEIVGNVGLEHMIGDPARPDAFTDLLKGYGLDINLPDVNQWISDMARNSTESVNELAMNLVEPAARGIADFAAFGAVLLISLLLLRIVAGLVNRVAKLPVLNLANKIGGTAVGAVYGAAISYISVLLIYYALPYLAANTPLASAGEITDQTLLFKFFFETSPVKF